METITAVGKERNIGDLVQVGGAGEDALGFFAPVFGIAGVLKFGFDGGESLQDELESVGEGDGVLAGDASGDLVNEEFAESDVDGSGRLEIADGGENIGGDDISSGDTAHFAIEMVMAERIVPGIVGGGTAFAVGAKVLAAAVWDGRNWLGGCGALSAV